MVRRFDHEGYPDDNGQFVMFADHDALAADFAEQVRVTGEHQRLRYQCETENTRLAAELAECKSDLAATEKSDNAAHRACLDYQVRVDALEAALAQVATDLAYKDDVSIIARVAAAQQTLKNIFTVQYPCGCEASGPPALPTYCPAHSNHEFFLTTEAAGFTYKICGRCGTVRIGEKRG